MTALALQLATLEIEKANRHVLLALRALCDVEGASSLAGITDAQMISELANLNGAQIHHLATVGAPLFRLTLTTPSALKVLLKHADSPEARAFLALQAHVTQ
ncbi:MAG: hypothetical protein ABL985_05995 [Casimicrobium sp.]